MKKIFMFIFALIVYSAIPVHAETVQNNWTLTAPSNGTAEVSSEETLDGEKSLHIKNNDDEVTASHLMAATGSLRRTYRVTFYAKGTYSEDEISVGTGTKTTASNPIAITFMPLSHEKVEKENYGNGWIRYTYLFRGNISNNSEFKFVFASGEKDIYIDNVSIEFDSSSEDNGYLYTGYGILADGSFEDDKAGENIEDYGWSSNINSVTTNSPAGAATVEPAAKVIEDEKGNKMLFVRYNYNGWSPNGLLLTKTMGQTGWENFYVSFKAKGAFLPNVTEVGSTYDDQLKRLVGGSDAENPYGEFVSYEKLENGWGRYTVKTFGEGNVFRIKFNGNCLGVLLDDFSAWTEDGRQLEVANGSFDLVEYDSKQAFAENWSAICTDSTSYVQRDITLNNYAIFMRNQDKNKKASFYQEIDGIAENEEYVVSFDAKTFFENTSIKVGFGENADNFTGVKLSDMAQSGNRYQFTIKAAGTKLIFAASGITDGLWIDNVSVKTKDDTELIKNGDFSIKTQPPEYYAGKYKLYKNDTEAQIGTGVYSVGIDVENNFRENDMEFTLIVSHVRDKKMIKCSQNSISLAANGDTDDPSNLKCDIDLSDYEDGDMLEVFLWNNTSDKVSLKTYGVFK